MTNSTIDLDKLERLEREATPGSWYWSKDDDYRAHYLISSPRLETVLECDHCNEPDTADKNFIVALRNAAPALFAELRTLRARVAELERDARLGAVVREVVATGGVDSDEPDQLDGYAQSLADDHSMFGAAVIQIGRAHV